jgi:hypothetical protein
MQVGDSQLSMTGDEMSEQTENTNSSTDPQVELAKLLDEAEKMGEHIAEEGRKLTQEGQQVVDLARATRPLIKYAEPVNIESLITDWGVVNQQAGLTVRHIKVASSASLMSTAGTAAYTTVTIFEPQQILPSVSPQERPAVEADLKKLQDVTRRAADEDEVLSLMNELGLDLAHKGQRSPAFHFSTAHKAFKAPVSSDNPVSTSLIPMREAIRLTIDHLLKRRPIQEETKTPRAKILSIGVHLKRDMIPQDAVESWAQQWGDLLDYLSTAKEQDMSREVWHLRLQQATLFLKGFLGGLDPEKVNRKRR